MCEELGWEEDEINLEAARQLIERYKLEYRHLVTLSEHRVEVARLEAAAEILRRRIVRLEALNPDGANVPALQETLTASLERQKEMASRLAGLET